MCIGCINLRRGTDKAELRGCTFTKEGVRGGASLRLAVVKALAVALLSIKKVLSLQVKGKPLPCSSVQHCQPSTGSSSCTLFTHNLSLVI